MRRILAASVVLLAPLAGTSSEPLLWPLELQPALSSTFGETRSTAFHAGIDLKTWGKTGYAVRAVDDGWILRVRTSPWGYGRALYQQLHDGRIAVYAHLESFFEPVQDRVIAAQRARRQYSVQLWPEKDEIPVRRGQIIGRTGQSGGGPPHLHVEIRDANNVPMNPLLHGLGPVADTTPPTLRRLLVTPLSATSLVDNRGLPVSIPLKYSDGQYHAVRPVQVWGRFGLAVDSHDRADLATNKMAALSHELRVDGSRVMTSTFERVSWSDGHLISLDRLRPGDGFVYTVLYQRRGNRLPFYQVSAMDKVHGGDGSLLAGGDGLPEGPHEITVQAVDVAGNRSVATMQVEVVAPPAMTAPDRTALADAETANFDLTLQAIARPQHVLLKVLSPEALSGSPRVEVDGRRVLLRRIAQREFAGTVSLQDVEANTIIVAASATAKGGRLGYGEMLLAGQPVEPGRADRISLLAGDVVLQVEAGSAFEILYPQAQRLRPVASAGLTATGRGCILSPSDAAFDARARISMRVVEDLPGLGVYADDGKGRWIFIGADVDSTIAGARTDATTDARTDERRLSARIRALGRFAIMQDHTPPTVANLSPAHGSRVQANVVVSAAIADAGSGITREQDVVLELDGVRLISEYDPEAETVTASADEPLEPGSHSLVLTLRDAAGNETVATSDFTSR